MPAISIIGLFGEKPAARDEALKVLTQTVSARPQMFWETDHLKLTVTDASGLALFSLLLSSHDAPALSKDRPGAV